MLPSPYPPRCPARTSGDGALAAAVVHGDRNAATFLWCQGIIGAWAHQAPPESATSRSAGYRRFLRRGFGAANGVNQAFTTASVT
jgi:hypothetical protein